MIRFSCYLARKYRVLFEPTVDRLADRAARRFSFLAFFLAFLLYLPYVILVTVCGKPPGRGQK